MLKDLQIDINDDVVEFVQSEEFKRFEKIMKGLYFSRLISFQTNPDDKEILAEKKILNVYCSLADSLKMMSSEILQNKLEDKQREE